MKIKYNRFALLPHTCSRCEKAFWLEPYKHYKVEEFHYKVEDFSFAGCIKYVTNICKECNEALEQTEEGDKE